MLDESYHSLSGEILSIPTWSNGHRVCGLTGHVPSLLEGSPSGAWPEVPATSHWSFSRSAEVTIPECMFWASWPIRLHFTSGVADLWLQWSVSPPSQHGLTHSGLTKFFSLCGPFSLTHQFSYCSWGRSSSCLYCFGPERRALWQNRSRMTTLTTFTKWTHPCPHLSNCLLEKTKEQLHNFTLSYRPWGHGTKQRVWYKITAICIQLTDVPVNQGKNTNTIKKIKPNK